MTEGEGEHTREPGASGENRKPNRKRPVHGVIVERGKPTIVFVTTCTRGRKRWLATPELHETLQQAWMQARAWLVGRYIVMPDHIHLFAARGEQDVELEVWMRYWKRIFGQMALGKTGRWQESHWDTRLRTAKAYQEKWEYVRDNPVRHGLVERAEDWPFAGEMCDLRW